MGLCIDVTTGLSIEVRRESIVITGEDGVSGEFYKWDIQNLMNYLKAHPEHLVVKP